MAQLCVFSGEPLISVLRSPLEDKIGQRTPSQVNREECPSALCVPSPNLPHVQKDQETENIRDHSNEALTSPNLCIL